MDNIRMGEIALLILKEGISSAGGLVVTNDIVASASAATDLEEVRTKVRISDEVWQDFLRSLAVNTMQLQEQKSATVSSETSTEVVVESGESEAQVEGAASGQGLAVVESGAEVVLEGAQAAVVELTAGPVENGASSDAATASVEAGSTESTEENDGDILPPPAGDVTSEVQVEAAVSSQESEAEPVIVESGAEVAPEGAQVEDPASDAVTVEDGSGEVVSEVSEAVNAEPPVAERESGEVVEPSVSPEPEVSGVVLTVSEELVEGEKPIEEAVQAS